MKRVAVYILAVLMLLVLASACMGENPNATAAPSATAVPKITITPKVSPAVTAEPEVSASPQVPVSPMPSAIVTPDVSNGIVTG